VPLRELIFLSASLSPFKSRRILLCLGTRALITIPLVRKEQRQTPLEWERCFIPTNEERLIGNSALPKHDDDDDDDDDDGASDRHKVALARDDVQQGTLLQTKKSPSTVTCGQLALFYVSSRMQPQ